MVEHLGEAFRFKVVTRDRDVGDSAPYADYPTHTWARVGRAEVTYLPVKDLGLRGWRRILSGTPHDVLYLCSFFHPRFTIIPLMLLRLGLVPRRPIVVAPHGEFSLGALRLKASKKSLYIRAAKTAQLYDHVLWHASSPYEESDIHRVFGTAVQVAVGRDLPSPSATLKAPRQIRRKQRGTLSVVFLSRISRKKNLDGALRLLAALEGDVEFHIYGPREDQAYWTECQQLIAGLRPNIRVQEHGPVPQKDVAAILESHHLFLFPTHGENFGHVVLEALLAGCVPLISDQTFWRGLQSRGVGWDLPLGEAGQFHASLQRCVDMDEVEFQSLSSAARRFGQEVASDPVAIDQNRAILNRAVGTGPRV
jgi:glycosyltransferase involved in cell wall biosynthesis